MYVAIGVNFRGKTELIGSWLSESEGAKFWHSCLTDLQKIDQTASVPEAETELEHPSTKCDAKYPTIWKQWKLDWPHIIAKFELDDADTEMERGPQPLCNPIRRPNASDTGLNHTYKQGTKNIYSAASFVAAS
jgi:transposase-like protein